MSRQGKGCPDKGSDGQAGKNGQVRSKGWPGKGDDSQAGIIMARQGE
ncbi:hypothetical protein E2C01_026539 [Portunus trituberculatus]|uniref:Uncharacterized protein n=1 Tax=Portunus trituberculatus TaxID=210409 RepID=A0A5B7EJ20_PORTR|nr:hypothetical protein [Portunus trituberculatus]